MLTRWVVLAALAAGGVVHAEPTRVFVGMHVVDLRSVDLRAGSFYADLYLWRRFNQPADEKLAEALGNLEPANGKFDGKELIDDKLVDGERYLCHRVSGTFFFQPDLHKYPFDSQTLPITVEATQLGAADVVFVEDRDSYVKSGEPEDRWGLNPGLELPDYVFKGVRRRTWEARYPTTFGDPTEHGSDTRYARFTWEATFQRQAASYAFKILVPLLIILAMTYLVFFLPADQHGTSATVAMTGLLSVMAFNVAVSGNMPDIGYLVLSDKFFIATFLLLLVTLIETFVIFTLDRKGKPELAVRIEKTARVVFPLLVAGIFVFFLAGV